MSAEPTKTSRKLLKAAHLAWGALVIIVCAILVLAPQRGHPPPLVLVPPVLLAWPLGHVFIWGLGWLADKGRRSVMGTGASANRRPAVVVIALMGAGAASVAGLVQLAGNILQGRWYPYQDPALWSGMLLIWIVHAVCLVVLLLRKPWARPLSAALALGWAVLLGAQVAGKIIGPASRTDVGELLFATGLMALLVALAISLVASKAVKSFFNH